jgi:hypothetical protein
MWLRGKHNSDLKTKYLHKAFYGSEQNRARYDLQLRDQHKTLVDYVFLYMAGLTEQRVVCS